ncbi:P2Y purinoceptor 8 isoform X2 [Eleginops maclovinus]|uniref:P2Y purinoceptor 8 isoform X2 n=1 Tax=Eleginops maclovinus TaxID=56733 RepID=UPI0030806349
MIHFLSFYHYTTTNLVSSGVTISVPPSTTDIDNLPFGSSASVFIAPQVCKRSTLVMRSHSHPVMTGNHSFKLDNATLYLFLSVNTSITISVIYMIVTVINLITYQLQGYDWTLGSMMCSVMTLVFYTNMYCSILTMMAIGIVRYLGIILPMRYRDKVGTGKKKIIAIISCMLMWGLVLSVLHPLMKTDLTFYIPELKITTCFDILKREMLPSKAAWATFLFSMVFFLFLLPFCVTTFCYVRVILKLAKDSKTAQKKRAIHLISVVLLVFTFCFAPNNILLFAHAVLKLFYGQSLYMAYKLSLCLSCLNSCLDPFIYYFACKEFRQKLRKLMNLSSQSSADSMKTKHKECSYSAHYNCDSLEREDSKVSYPQRRSTK